jgi:hypothetical protein
MTELITIGRFSKSARRDSGKSGLLCKNRRETSDAAMGWSEPPRR